MIACPSLPRLGTGVQKRGLILPEAVVGGASECPQGVLGALGAIDKVHRVLWRNIPGLSGGSIRMATNGVDDCQKTMAHCR